ncbi:hypothetical protein CDD83_465 [Cordyceps sp. RAO-2017]|nr:hypothetical protein CDD83_465 [Cordyceps sp. RAO-2017]
MHAHALPPRMHEHVRLSTLRNSAGSEPDSKQTMASKVRPPPGPARRKERGEGGAGQCQPLWRKSADRQIARNLPHRTTAAKLRRMAEACRPLSVAAGQGRRLGPVFPGLVAAPGVPSRGDEAVVKWRAVGLAPVLQRRPSFYTADSDSGRAMAGDDGTRRLSATRSFHPPLASAPSRSGDDVRDDRQ